MFAPEPVMRPRVQVKLDRLSGPAQATRLGQGVSVEEIKITERNKG
jgi:hypothetical protein